MPQFFLASSLILIAVVILAGLTFFTVQCWKEIGGIPAGLVTLFTLAAWLYALAIASAAAQYG